MKTIESWAGMHPYGIVPLTAEVDGLKYRVVCDVTERGKQLLEKSLGIIDIQLGQNWDFGTNEEPHIGCVMLFPEILLMIGVYALFDDGCHEVWTTRNLGLVGIQQGDSQQAIENLQLYYGNELIQRYTCQDTIGNRNPCFLS